jgi:hypothetical protein
VRARADRLPQLVELHPSSGFGNISAGNIGGDDRE